MNAAGHSIEVYTDWISHCLFIDKHNNTLDFSLALSVAQYFRLSKSEALSIMEAIRGVVSTWQERAKAFGIRRAEIPFIQRAVQRV